MPSALEQLTGNYETAQPVDFNAYYNAYYKDKYPNNIIKNSQDKNPYSWTEGIENIFTGTRTSAEKAYQNYLAEYEFRKNAKATAAANKETYAREDNSIERLFDQYQRVGLNPYMMLTGGNVSLAPSSQAQRPDYKRSSKNSKERSGNGSVLGTALKLLAILALKG